MATLVKRGKYYHGVIHVNGKQVWRSLRTGDREEAERRLLELESRYTTSPTFVKGNIPIEEFYNLWMERYVKMRLKISTYQTYEHIFRLYVLPVLGNVRLCDLTVDHVQSLLLHLRSSGLSDTTVHDYYRKFQGMLSLAEEWGYIEYNIAKKAKPPPRRQQQLKVWTPEEAAQFIKFTESHPLHPLWVTALLTGMRRGELCGLYWEDVDFRRNLIHVVRQVTVLPDGKPIELSVKTEHSERSIAMGTQLRELLLRHKDSVEAMKKAYWKVWNSDKNYVFPHINHRHPEKTGSYWDPDLVLYHFKRQCKLAGVPRIRFHDLRHTHFTLLSEAGVSLTVIKERAGHRSVQTTGDLYTHPTSRAHTEAAETGESMLLANDPLSKQLASGEGDKG